MKKALVSHNISYSSTVEHLPCAACLKAKCHKLPFHDSDKKFEVLEVIHTYLWGPTPVSSRNGYIYYVSFVDHAEVAKRVVQPVLVGQGTNLGWVGPAH